MFLYVYNIQILVLKKSLEIVQYILLFALYGYF